MCMTDEQFTAYTLQAAVLLAVTNGEKPIQWRMLHGDLHELYMINDQPVVLTRLCVADGKAAAVIVLPYTDWSVTMDSVAFGSAVADYFTDAMAATTIAKLDAHIEARRQR